MRIAYSGTAAVVAVLLLGACGSGGSAGGNAEANAASGNAVAASAATSTANVAVASEGGWTFATTGCAAEKMIATETGLRIGVTRERLTIGFMGPGSAASGAEVPLSVWAGANASEATQEVGQLVEHDGVRWLEFSVPNDEPGGWQDRISNSPSISAAYGNPRQQVTVSLADSNAVMRRLRSCAGF